MEVEGEEEEDEDDEDDDEGDEDDDDEEDEDEDDEGEHPFGDQFQELEDAIYRLPLDTGDDDMDLMIHYQDEPGLHNHMDAHERMRAIQVKPLEFKKKPVKIAVGCLDGTLFKSIQILKRKYTIVFPFPKRNQIY